MFLEKLKFKCFEGIATKRYSNKALIENCEYFPWSFHENINCCLDKSLLFPLDLKLADPAPVYKKKSKSSKVN